MGPEVPSLPIRGGVAFDDASRAPAAAVDPTRAEGGNSLPRQTPDGVIGNWQMRGRYPTPEAQTAVERYDIFGWRVTLGVAEKEKTVGQSAKWPRGYATLEIGVR